MITQLLLSKRLYTEAAAYASKRDGVSCGIAVSLLQDSAEMLVWALVKHRGLLVKDGAGFTSNLDALHKDGLSIPETPKLLELNKARVGFKHYGNIPASTEAQKYLSYVEDFLRSALKNNFNHDYDGLSLVDLVPFPEIRGRLKDAEGYISRSEFREAVIEASIVKVELFRKLKTFIPEVAHDLQYAESENPGTFKYVASYLSMLREMSLLTLLHVPLEEYSFLNNTLFSAMENLAGKWLTSDSKFVKYDEAICRRQIACLVDISIRMHSVV